MGILKKATRVSSFAGSGTAGLSYTFIFGFSGKLILRVHQTPAISLQAKQSYCQSIGHLTLQET